MTYEEVLTKAKEVLAPKCRVCKVCNGIACKGEIPGVGAVGNGAAFIECRNYLDKIKIHMDAVHEHFEPDTKIVIRDRELSAPIMIAPIGGMGFNYTGYLSEIEYSEAIVFGGLEAGIVAFTGDGPHDDYFPSTLPIIQQVNGRAIPTIKPWEREKVLGRIDAIKNLGCFAFAMDIDSAALINLKLQGKPAYTKSEKELSEFVEKASIPFIVKGIMTPESAQRCVDAGAAAIVVSTHGGRILQDTLPPVSVLSSIKEKVGDSIKIYVDGGIRSGADVFKCIALGADAVLIGRPYVIAAHGGGAEGVRLYTEKIISELKDIMLMTNCRNISEITREKIIVI